MDQLRPTRPTGQTGKRANDSVTIEITDQAKRIAVPQTIVPTVNGGGADGWWQLADVVVTDTEITAKFSFNFINKPKVRIDRRTGRIVIDALGASGFSGTCRPFEPTARAF